MPVELLDTQDIINGPWRIAVLERIECITDNAEVFFYLRYVGWESYYSEWIPAQSYRIRLLYDRQGEIIRKCEFYFSTDLVLKQPVDYYLAYGNPVNGRGLWKKGLVSRIEEDYRGCNIQLMDENQQLQWARCIAKHGTFA